MSHAPTLSLLIAAALLGTGVPATRAHAQNTLVDLVDEELTLKVPFVLRNVSPEINSVGMRCVVHEVAGGGGNQSQANVATALVSSLGKQEAGTIAGTFEFRHVFQRKATITGKKGSIHCFLSGSTPTSGNKQFSTQPGTDSRFRVPGYYGGEVWRRPDIMYHEFTW